MKKIILLYLVLQLSHSLVNAQIGLAGNITTLGVAQYPTHIDSLGKGGYMVLPTIEMRNNIPTLRRKQGMMVYVQSVDSLYKLNSASLDNTWVTIGLSSSDDVSGFVKYAKTSDSLFITKGTRIDEGLLVKKDLTVGGNLILTSGLQFNDSLIVQKGARIEQSILAKSKLYVSDSLLAIKNVKIDSNLYVKGQGIFDSILTINDSLRVKGNILVDTNLTVGKDLEVKGNLILNSGLQFNDSLIVSKGARIEKSILAKSKLYVSDSILAMGNVKIDSNLYVKGQGIFDSLLTINDSLRVMGNVLIDTNLTVNKVTSLNDSLYVKGQARFDSLLTINDSLIVNGSATFSGNLFVKNLNINDSIMKYYTSKVNVADTSEMLLNYLTRINNLYTITSSTNSNVALKLNKADTSYLNDRILLRVKYTDTALMLSNRFARDTAYLSYRINSLVTSSGDLATSKLRIIDTNYLVQKSDTAAWLNSRFKRDTANLALRVSLLEQLTFENNALKINATTAYEDFLLKDDTITLSNRIDAVVAASNVMQNNIKVNFGGGSFGKYADGETIPSKGKTIDEVLTDIITRTIPPYYTPPTASLSMGESGTVEIGTNLGTLTFAPTFTQNRGGSFSSIAYYKNSSIVATNAGSPSITDVVGPLLAEKTYKVIYSYAAGTTILQNNLGQNDVTLQVTAGDVESNTITITPGSYKYWGVTSNPSSSITDTDILAMINGGQEWATSKAKSVFTITNSSGINYAYYAYPSALGDLISITSGGFESLNAFDKLVRNFTNAKGTAVSYNIYVQKNGGTENVSIIIN